MEQAQQELSIEPLETVGAVLLLDFLQAVAEVVLVAVQEALLLDEIDEHHAVEHQRGVPFPVALRGKSVDELLEGGQFRAEAFKEALGDALHVQRLPEPSR